MAEVVGYAEAFGRREPPYARAAIVEASDVQELLRRPEFPAARRKAAVQLIEEYGATRLLNRVFNDRGHQIMGLLVHYLHHVPLPGEDDAGLTVGRFRTLCASAEIASPGRATAMLNLMRFAGYLRAVPSPDRRRTLLAPTERFLKHHARRWRRHFEASALVTPEGRLALQLWEEPRFQIAFQKIAIEGYLGGFRVVQHTPELAHCFENVSGFMILLRIEMASGEASVVPLTIRGLATQCCTSRAHVRNVLARASADGLLDRTGGSHDAIAVRPALRSAMDRFFASGFAFTSRCVRIATNCAELGLSSEEVAPLSS